MLKIFDDKVETIKDLCQNYGLAVDFVVVIRQKIGNRPLNKISKKFLSFASSLDAEIGFDLYCYGSDDKWHFEAL